MKKTALLLLCLFNTLQATEPSNNGLGNYSITQHTFMKHGEKMPTDDFIVNKETNQSTKIDGKVKGMEFITFDEKEMLKVNFFAGAHTHVVSFYVMDKKGDLTLVEGGNIGSDIGDPAMYLDSLNNVLVVFSRYRKDIFTKDKLCFQFKEDVYEYKNHKFEKILENNLAPEECEE